jgi:ABC-type multidrug transport system fused ATPase/permease subunit
MYAVSVHRMNWVAELPREDPKLDSVDRGKSSFEIKEGSVEFKNVSLRYSPDAPLSLKNLNFSIRPGMKVGICGRTGSGKSSALSALFRMVDIESTGSIEIDGQDISTANLYDLRSAMCESASKVKPKTDFHQPSYRKIRSSLL